MDLGGLLTRIKNRWHVISGFLRVAVVLVLIGMLACVSFLIVNAIKPTYAPLFTALGSKDAGQITEELKSMRVPYQITDQGKTILVPQSQVYEVRNQLAGAGKLAGEGKGFELFDESRFGQSNYEQRVNYQRALQEELRRTVMHMDAVQDARVHLVMPERSVFVEDQGTTSASVTLELKPGVQLTPQQVQGIGDLFFGSVEGLTPENLYIHDTSGNVLSDELSLATKPDALLLRQTEEQLRMQRQYERDLVKKIQQMLNPITGQDNFVATVTAVLDFNKQEITSSNNDNPNNLRISEHHVRETGRAGDVGGPVGTDSNVTLTTPFVGSLNTSDYTREEDTINYQVSTSQETVVTAPGRVKRLSVAVVVNDNTNAVFDEGKIKDAVAAAIGFDPERGDQISVTSQSFDDTRQRQAEAERALAERQQEMMQLYLLIGAAALLLLLLIILVIYLIVRRRRHRRRMEEEQLEREMEESQERLGLAPGITELEPHVPDPVENKQDLLRKMAGEKPNEIAEVIKIWMRG